MEFSLTRFEELSLDAREIRTAAELIFDALPDMYGRIPLAPEATLDLIAAEMQVSGTECYNPLILHSDGAVAGIICSFPLMDLASRQQNSLLHIMRGLDKASRKQFRTLVAAGNHSVAPTEGTDGSYIARISVRSDLRGKGAGTVLFSQYAALDPGPPITLHVDRGNASAISYYKRLGFEFCGSADHQKWAMVRR